MNQDIPAGHSPCLASPLTDQRRLLPTGCPASRDPTDRSPDELIFIEFPKADGTRAELCIRALMAHARCMRPVPDSGPITCESISTHGRRADDIWQRRGKKAREKLQLSEAGKRGKADDVRWTWGAN